MTQGLSLVTYNPAISLSGVQLQLAFALRRTTVQLEVLNLEANKPHMNLSSSLK